MTWLSYYLPIFLIPPVIGILLPKWESDTVPGRPGRRAAFNFCRIRWWQSAGSLISIEDPGKIVLNQMAHQTGKDILLKECHISLVKTGGSFWVVYSRKRFIQEARSVMYSEETGIRLDYSDSQKRVILGYYGRHKVNLSSFTIRVVLALVKRRRIQALNFARPLMPCSASASWLTAVRPARWLIKIAARSHHWYNTTCSKM